MSRSVDERIVEMRFDNQQFERNVQTTMGTLDKLKQSLKLDGASKGLDDVNKAAKGVSLDGIAAGVEALQKRFSTFGIIGMQVIQNLTNSVMGFAKNTLGFLTDSIINGGKRRAMNIENAHFQLQGLLKDEEKVQAVMKDAMDSVDGTAYAYDEAAKAASQFAASGMEAGEQMQSSLRAITGVAAMTNSEYEDISRVFTTVAGNGRLMGDQLLQLSSRGLNAAATIKDYFNGVNDGSIEASESVTAAIKELTGGLETTEGDIREFVSGGKISFEMFASAMDDAFGEHAKKANETFTGAMSNVKAALARIGAEFISPLIVQNGPLVQFFNALRERVNDVKANIGPLAKLFTDSVSSMADAATKYLQKLDLTKHFEAFYNVVDGLQNVLKGIGTILKPIGQAFRDIFPPVTMDAVVKFTENFKNLTANFKLSDTASANLRSTFKGLFAVVDIVAQAIGALVKLFLPATAGLVDLGGGILGVTGKFGEWLASIDEAIKKNELFTKAVQKVHDTVGPIFSKIGDMIKGAIQTIKDFANTHFKGPDTSGLENFTEKLKTRLEPLKKVGEVIKAIFGGIVNVFKAAAPTLAKVGGTIVDTIGKVCDGILKALSGGGFDTITDLLNGGMMVGIGVGISKFISNLTKMENVVGNTINKWGGIGAGIQTTINKAKGALADLQATLKADVLKKIAVSIAILAASLLVLSMIDSDKLGGALASVSILFGELTAVMAIMNKSKMFEGANLKGMNQAESAMIKMSVAILILASALKKIADIDSDKLAGALVGVTVLIGELVAASLVLSKWGGKVETSAVGMILFAEAINILAKAVGKLAELDTDALTRGLVGVGVLMGELAAFMVAARFGNFKVTQGLAIIELAAALLILEKAVDGFGSMKIEVIKQGLIGVGVILAEVAAFSVIAGKAKHINSTATSLVIIGAAMLIFGKAIQDIGSLPMETIGKGLLGIAGALAAVTVAVNFMPKNMIGIGLGLIEVAAGLKIIVSALQTAGGMSWEEVGKGMVVLAGSMTILAVALNFMKGTLGAAAAILVVSAALAVLTPVLKSLGSMSLAEIGKALLVLAGAFTVLGIAGAVLGPLVPAILGLSAAIALLGVGALACGAGILALATGLSALAVSGVAGVTALVAALEILIVGVLNIIANSAKAIANAVKAIVLAIVDVIVSCAPAIAEGVLTLVEEVLASLAAHAPAIVTYLMDFLIGVINALAEKLPELIQAAVNLIGAFFQGVVDALKGIDTNTLVEGIVGIGLLSAIMLALAAVAGLIPAAMVGVLGMGAVIAELSLVLAAIGALAQLPGLKWLIGEGGDLLQGVGTAIGKFVGGIVGGFMEGVSAQFPKIGQDLTDFMTNIQGFIDGAKQIDAKMLDGVNALAKTILLLTAANILDGLTKWFTGGTSLVKFGEELAEFGPYFKKYANDISGINPEVITASSNAALALAEMASKLPNSGGLAGKIFGENNLSQFGEELSQFGPYIKKYGDQVKGLDAGAVKASAEAAQVLADMASTLPNSGGLAAKIMGDNTLSAFGQELEKFGPHISKYAKDVNGVNPAAVKASAEAAQVLSDMANTLPNSGGLAAKIMGDNTLSAFGEELEKFGPHIAKYSQDVAGVQPSVVTASANAAKALAELANNLPNTGGLVSWFTGDNDIGKFGESLEKFGKSFAGYYNSIAGINTSLLGSVVAELKKLVDLANGIAGIDTSGFSRFGNDLQAMGNKGIDGFISAFTNANAKVQQGVTALINTVKTTMQGQAGALTTQGNTAGQALGTGLINGMNAKKPLATSTAKTICTTLITTMKTSLPSNTFNQIGQTNVMQALINGMNAKKPLLLSTVKNICTALIQQFRTSLPSSTFNTIGQNIIQGIINGMNAKKPLLLSTAKNICEALISQFKTSLPTSTFNDLGQAIIQALINGMNSKKSAAENAAKEICTAVINAFKNNLGSNSLYDVGANAAQGLANGIRSKIDEIAKAAIAAAKEAIEKAKKELNENSPSKVFFEMGEYIDIGLANGIYAYLDTIGDAGTELGDTAITSMRSAIARIADAVNEEMDIEPTISPVLDLSNVADGVSTINGLFSQGLDMSASYGKALAAANNRYASAANSDDGTKAQSVSNSYNFTQNNYSPTALSRKDIYRQTKNQFAAMRGAVSGI